MILMLPVAMIRDLVAERQARRNEAVSGIAEGWGKRQTVAGPYLAIPYERHWTVVKRETVDGKLREIRTGRSESQVVRLPAASVEWTVDTEISEKARGIYKARLYGAKLQAQGAFSLPARAGLEDGASRYKWDAPRLVLGISDPLGIRAAPAVSVNGRNYDFAPGPGDSALAGGLHAPLAGQPASCAFPCNRMGEQISVSLIEPVGLYQQLERASKYGFLFIGLTFAAFLLFELLRRLAIHPAQYGLVGLALAMFFLLLTALSEHIDFAAAYAIASFACVGLVTGYLVRVLRSAGIGLAFGGALAALYAMLYALLKAEDYSLLGGSLLLFGLLAALMIATHRVDWYGLGSPRPAGSG